MNMSLLFAHRPKSALFGRVTEFEMELPLSKQGKIDGERRVFQDKCTDQGSPDHYFFIARKSNVFSLLGNGCSHE